MEKIASWQEEKRSAYIYQILSQIEHNPIHKKMFLELSHMAEKQAAIWQATLSAEAVQVPPSFLPDCRTKIVIWLLRRLGPKTLRLALAAMKIRGMAIYNPALLPDSSNGNHLPRENQHRAIQTTGNLRAAIFGINDGLLSNASLIYGIVGASVGQHFIVLSGVAGLLAGAFSMAAGEYVSMRSQRQMLEYQIDLEQQELALYPAEEALELSLIYQARGLSKDHADQMSNIMISNPDKALDALTREELGINPDELGSPWGAAISSFCAFAIGAAIPLLPFIMGTTVWSLEISISLTAITFFVVGAAMNLFTGRSAWWGGLRMVLIGAAIGSVTYFIGSLFGVHVH